MATITLDMSEYESMKRRAESAEECNRKLGEELVAVKLDKSDGGMRAITVAFRHSLAVVAYAVGMLSPEFARKWPKDALLALCDGIRLIPDVTPHELELIMVIESFARDIDKYDATRSEKYVPPPIPAKAKGVESPDLVDEQMAAGHA